MFIKNVEKMCNRERTKNKSIKSAIYDCEVLTYMCSHLIYSEGRL